MGNTLAAKNPSAKDAEQGKYLVPVLLSTFEILNVLSRTGPLSLAELAHETGIARSTIFRILRTLHHLGYVWRENSRYSLSPRLGELSQTLAWAVALERCALPYMAKLRSEFDETVNLARLDSDRVLYLEVVESEQTLRLCERKGGWEHAHASALGKAILAFSPTDAVSSLLAGRLPALTPKTITEPKAFLNELRRVRQKGYALDREESRLQAVCIGVPILDREENAIAAISISGPTSRFNPMNNKRVAERLLKTAHQISSELTQVETISAENKRAESGYNGRRARKRAAS
jgi:DNA-binding IclR family transcriptional regulator